MFLKSSLICILILISISILYANLLSMCFDISYTIYFSIIGGREGKRKSVCEVLCEFTMP